MTTLKIQQAVDTVSGMRTLHDAMSADLDYIDACILELSSAVPEKDVVDELDTHIRARAALHGGIESINELLGWVRLMTEKDVDGNEYRVMWTLPNVALTAIN
jgi:hypothetical protein